MDLLSIIKRITPSFHDIHKDVASLRGTHAGKSPEELSQLYINKIRNRYAGVGAASALPGVIPGLGTLAQVAVEAGSVSADVVLMLRWMAAVTYGTGLIYGKDIHNDFDAEFTKVLGIWCGLLVPEEAVKAKDEKLSVQHFDKHITDRIANRMNQKIGQKLITKYGSKRGGVMLGKLIPFGIGAVVGGTFNYMTMQKFGKAADDYFSAADKNYRIKE
ncbi:MAG: hypothetical protein EOO45_21265 [Flavobacterium sp.]|nr:MAG: hypothetical protein EOO45_21265 [Flavobacterium sp.]